MKIISSSISQLKCSGEKGDYILLLPIGAAIKEAFEASSMFSCALARLYENYKEKTKIEKEKSQNSEKKVKKVKKDK